MRSLMLAAGFAPVVALRFKPQDRADRDMMAWLTTRYGLRGDEAWLLITVGRDGAPQAVSVLHAISWRHRLGWFHREGEESY